MEIFLLIFDGSVWLGSFGVWLEALVYSKAAEAQDSLTLARLGCTLAAIFLGLVLFAVGFGRCC